MIDLACPKNPYPKSCFVTTIDDNKFLFTNKQSPCFGTTMCKNDFLQMKTIPNFFEIVQSILYNGPQTVDNVRFPEAQNIACEALCCELDSIQPQIDELADDYLHRLPLESEESGVDWNQVCERLVFVRTDISDHHNDLSSYNGYQLLISKLENMKGGFENLIDNFYKEKEIDVYVDYSKRELQYCRDKIWNRHLRKIMNTLAGWPSSQKASATDQMLKDVISQIKSDFRHMTDDKGSVVYHEALGRLLWQVRHTPDKKDLFQEILIKVLTLEYLSAQLGRKFSYIDSDSLSEDKQKRQKEEKEVNDSIGVITYRLKQCQQYYAKGITDAFFTQLLGDLLNSPVAEKVRRKLNKNQRVKFACQIAGVLRQKSVFVGCSYAQLAEIIKFERIKKASCERYIREGFDGEPELENWLSEYVEN